MPASPDVVTETPLNPPVESVPRTRRGPGRPPKEAPLVVTTPATVETLPSETRALLEVYQARLRELPMFVDDIEGNFDEVYRNMADTDPQISSSIDILMLMAGAQPLKLETNADKSDEALYAEADLYRRFIQANLDRLHVSMQSLLYEMNEAATVEGHKMAEVVLEWGPNIDPTDADQQLWLRRISPKPRRAYRIVVNAFNERAGVAPRNAPSATSTTGPTQEAIKKDLIADDKLLWRINHARNSDSRGTSDLHDTYNIWWMNVQNWGLLIAALAQFAAPTAVFTDAETGKVQWTGTDGRPMPPLQSAQAGLTIAKSAKSSAAIRLAFGQTLTFLQAEQAIDQCLAFRKLVVMEIGKSITNQSLSTDQGEHQTGKAASEHKDILGLKPRYIQYEDAFMLEDQLFRLLINANYGPLAVPKRPRALLGQTQLWDIARDGQMLAQWKANGMIMPSQLAALYAGLDLPPAAQEELDRYTAWWFALYDPKNAMQPTTGTNGGDRSGGKGGAVGGSGGSDSTGGKAN